MNTRNKLSRKKMPQWLFDRLERLRGDAYSEKSVTFEMNEADYAANEKIPPVEKFREVLLERLKKMTYPDTPSKRCKDASVYDALHRRGLLSALLTDSGILSLRLELVIFKALELEYEGRIFDRASSNLPSAFHIGMLQSLLEQDAALRDLLDQFPDGHDWTKSHHLELMNQIHSHANALFPLYPAYPNWHQRPRRNSMKKVDLYQALFDRLQEVFRNAAPKRLTYHVISVLCSLYGWKRIFSDTISREHRRYKAKEVNVLRSEGQKKRTHQTEKGFSRQ